MEVSIKCIGDVCTVYDDKQRIELGTCDYNVVRDVLGESLKDNVRQHFGLPQATLDKLNLQNEEHTDLYNPQKNNSSSDIQAKPNTNDKPANAIQYIKANRTPKEEMDLQRQLAQSSHEKRQREQHVIDKSNGTKVRVSTRSLK